MCMMNATGPSVMKFTIVAQGSRPHCSFGCKCEFGCFWGSFSPYKSGCLSWGPPVVLFFQLKVWVPRAKAAAAVEGVLGAHAGPALCHVLCQSTPRWCHWLTVLYKSLGVKIGNLKKLLKAHLYSLSSVFTRGETGELSNLLMGNA